MLEERFVVLVRKQTRPDSGGDFSLSDRNWRWRENLTQESIIEVINTNLNIVDLLAYEISLPSEFITAQCRIEPHKESKLDTQDISRGKKWKQIQWEEKEVKPDLYELKSILYTQ